MRKDKRIIKPVIYEYYFYFNTETIVVIAHSIRKQNQKFPATGVILLLKILFLTVSKNSFSSCDLVY